jgi:hypothetical protein
MSMHLGEMVGFRARQARLGGGHWRVRPPLGWFEYAVGVGIPQASVRRLGDVSGAR